MLKTIPNITFVEGVPGDLESMINPTIWNFVVIDDLMLELSNDQRITNLFTKGCHHRNLSVIFILQNIFHRGKKLRDMSLNCHYLVMFKSYIGSSGCSQRRQTLWRMWLESHPPNMSSVKQTSVG